MIVAGTRPEAIKLHPLISKLRNHPRCRVFVCATRQHEQLFFPYAERLGLQIDRELHITDRELSPRQLAGLVRKNLPSVISEVKPDLMLVQGDTTSAIAAAEVALLQDIPIAHVEAGLRSHVLASPWPEEGNRREIDRMATWHFSPTKTNIDNLLQENQLPTRLHLTGNTGIDFALELRRRVLAGKVDPVDTGLPSKAPFVLCTLHRREGWQGGIGVICDALAKLLSERKDLHLVFPVHPNPRVKEQVMRVLEGHDRVRLLNPLPSDQFADLIWRSRLVVTDSGGVQEEAPLYKKRVLVAREATEREELMEHGYGSLVGFDGDLLLRAAREFLDSPAPPAASLFGDGRASRRIVDILLEGRTELPPPAAVTTLE